VNSTDRHTPGSYDAFISYSRADEEFARRLEGQFERYRPPRPIGRRRPRIFRDVQDLVGNDLPAAIQDAIARSRHLIVVCSPRARASAYVEKEIDAFAATHGTESIVAALIDGRPNHEVSPDDSLQDQAFPAALCRLFAEPLAADFRPHEADSRLGSWARRREARFALLASVLGVEKEELLRRQRARTIRRVVAGTLVALGVLLVVVVMATEARRARLDALARAAEASSQGLSERARSLVPTEIDAALLLGVEAHHVFAQPQAWSSLLAALQYDPRLVTILRGHEGNVGSLAFSPDGSRLASGSDDRTVRLWDTETWRPISGPLRRHDSAVLALEFSPDARRLVSVGNDGIRRWDVDSLQPVEPLIPIGDLHGGIAATAFSPDRRRLAIAGHFAVTLFDVDAWRPIGGSLQAPARPWFSAVTFTADGKQVVSADLRGGIQVWDPANQRPEGSLIDLGADTASLACSPDGRHCASGGASVWLLDIASRGRREPPQRGQGGDVYSLAFSPDGTRLVSRVTDGSAQVWTVDRLQTSGKPLQQRGMTGGLAFSPDGTLLAVGSDHEITIWRLERRQRLARVLRCEDRPWTVAMNRDGTRLLAGFAGGLVQVWDVETQRPLGPPVRAMPENKTVFNARFTAKGDRVALAADDQVVLWDVGRQEAVAELHHSGHPHYQIPALAFSPDGATLATGGMDHVARLWKSDTLEAAGALTGHDGTVLDVAFSGDGRLLATAGGDGTVRIWDSAHPQQTLRTGADPVMALRFADPDGKHLFSIDDAGEIRRWDVVHGRLEARSQEGGSGEVQAASFGADGKWLASLRGGSDGVNGPSIALWSVDDGAPIAEPLRADLDLSLPAWGNLAFSGDGKRLASGSAPDSIFVWDVDPSAWEREACRIANRNLSAAEWERYLGADVVYRCTCPGLPAGTGAPETGVGCAISSGVSR
jgi:WD40 repeat protein